MQRKDINVMLDAVLLAEAKALCININVSTCMFMPGQFMPTRWGPNPAA